MGWTPLVLVFGGRMISALTGSLVSAFAGVYVIPAGRNILRPYGFVGIRWDAAVGVIPYINSWRAR